ncbi:MAG: redoxin domain-containing protein [Anaerolineales bacterium]|nr:redoxin domain-containing protein [Anaerolineales bacterium]
MSRAELNKPAPNFTLTDYKGNEVSLADFQGKKNVLLVFNRGFF